MNRAHESQRIRLAMNLISRCAYRRSVLRGEKKQHERAVWMSRRLDMTVLTSVMTANTSLPRKQPKRCIRRTSQREGRTATWTAHAGPGGHFFLWTPTNAPTRAKKCRHCGVKSAEEMIIHRNDLIIVMLWVWVGSQKVEPMRGTRRYKNGRAQRR